MNKDRYQSTSARRALALLNSPQKLGTVKIIQDSLFVWCLCISALSNFAVISLCLDCFLTVVKLSLPRGATGLCVASDCGISWS